MANIMMTDVCNLHCPYCFANEFVNINKNEITEDAFDRAVNFIVGDGSHSSVGLIGGEPTVHPKFDYFMRKLICDERVRDIIVYTNGIRMNHFWDVLCHPKTHLLINCNSPTDIGENQFMQLCDNLKILIDEKLCADRVTLGINMYSPNFEYNYLLELLLKYKLHRVRVSITVPNLDEKRNVNPHSYFLEIKGHMIEFFHKLLCNEIIPNFDCNKIPSCLLENGELDEFSCYLENDFIRKNISKSNITTTEVHCVPVIDIRQDLTAVRCFGLSSCTKQDISKFSGIKELENYYLRTVDAFAYNTSYCNKCVDCHMRKVMKCTGGCLAYKINQICKLSDFAEKMMSSF